jgi:tetratricopeptide (TPR) repeat protein
LLVAACAQSRDDSARGSVTSVPEASDAIDEKLMVALGQAKNFHHKAKLYTSEGNLAAATASVREILKLEFPPNAPEAEDVRNDARALLAKLLIAQGQIDEAARVVDEGIAQSGRESFFVANLYTVRGEIHEARAAQLGDDPKTVDEKHAAMEAYDRSIKINERIQKQLMEEP